MLCGMNAPARGPSRRSWGLEFAPTEAADGSVLPHRHSRALQGVVIMEGRLRGIVERTGDDASIEPHGSSRSIVGRKRRVGDHGVWHATDPDEIGSAVNNLEIRRDPTEGCFRWATGNFAIDVRVSRNTPAARIEAGKAGAPQHTR